MRLADFLSQTLSGLALFRLRHPPSSSLTPSLPSYSTSHAPRLLLLPDPLPSPLHPVVSLYYSQVSRTVPRRPALCLFALPPPLRAPPPSEMPPPPNSSISICLWHEPKTPSDVVRVCRPELARSSLQKPGWKGAVALLLIHRFTSPRAPSGPASPATPPLPSFTITSLASSTALS